MPKRAKREVSKPEPEKAGWLATDPRGSRLGFFNHQSEKSLRSFFRARFRAKACFSRRFSPGFK